MSTNQGDRQEFFRAISGTTTDYNGDFLAAAAVDGFTGEFNGVFIRWLQDRTGSSATNLDGLKQEFAVLAGAHNWESVGGVPIILPGCQLWLKSNDRPTVIQSSNSVSQWRDKSGKGNNTDIQGIGADQPTLINNQMNGKPIIRGNGTSSVLEIPNLGLNGLSSVTMFMVINIDNTTDGFDSLFAFGTGAEGGLHTSSSGFARIVKTQDGLGILANGTSISSGLADSNNIFMLTTDGTTVITEENGVEIVSLAQAGNWATGAGNYAIFASSSPNRWLKIDIAEILIYNRSLSTAEIAVVEQYLSFEWGITLA